MRANWSAIGVVFAVCLIGGALLWYVLSLVEKL